MEADIITTLIELTRRSNDEVKIAAVSALGDYRATIEQEIAISRLIELCKDSNKDVAISAIKSLGKLAHYF